MELSEEYKKAKNEALTKHILEMEALHDPAIEALRLHTRALACHCECLGMNAENCIAVTAGTPVPHGEMAYQHIMQKWELIDDEGKIAI